MMAGETGTPKQSFRAETPLSMCGLFRAPELSERQRDLHTVTLPGLVDEDIASVDP